MDGKKKNKKDKDKKDKDKMGKKPGKIDPVPPGAKTAPDDVASSPRIDYLLTMIRLTSTGAEIIAAKRSRTAPPTPEPVRITQDDWEDLRPGDGEVVFAVYVAGQPLRASATQTWGKPLRKGVHFDSVHPRERARLVGGTGRPRQDDRLLHLDLRDGDYLVAYRVQVAEKTDGAPGGPSPKAANWNPAAQDDWESSPVVHKGADNPRKRLAIRLLHVWGLPGDDRSNPPAPSQIPIPFSTLAVNDGDYTPLEPAGWPKPGGENSCGYVRSQTTYLHRANTTNAYNIVILGDGFSEFEYMKFNRWSKALALAFKRTAPFSGYPELNIHAVRCISKSSGIAACPCECDRACSYLGVQGNWKENPDDPTYPAFMGTYDFPWIYWVAERVAPIECVQLIVVLANCPVPGGSAYMDEKVVFLALGDESWLSESAAMQTFAQIGLHESAHVVANLADEYIACDTDGYKNNFNCYDGNGAPYWMNLLTGEEIAEGKPRYIHGYDPAQGSYDDEGDPIFFGYVGTPLVKGSPPYRNRVGKMGLYWGCQYVDGTATGDCTDVYRNPKGQGFFRPEARCSMRRLFHTEQGATVPDVYCRVCERALLDSLEKRAPITLP